MEPWSYQIRILSSLLETVPVPTTQKYNWKKVAWDKFKEQLVTDAENTKELRIKLILYNTTENLQDAARTLMKSIKKAADAHALSHNILPRTEPWWTEDLTKTQKHIIDWLIDRSYTLLHTMFTSPNLPMYQRRSKPR